MSVGTVLEVIRDAFIRILLVASPALGVALVVGVVISIFQAVTQIQEQTLSFVPKLVAILVAMIVCGNFMLTMLLEFTKSIFRMIAKM
ncbi:flagellar biosynthesis protein FliQ [Periweissella fabaria]|uniref:Flagellar biosynthetic protein FliQ n=2 Tax=Periweissella TaxID=2930384 RepID=A0ABM8ZB00_9LACO|nr:MULTISPECIES: flagellar biosynthesis protein FliQ [Periweissella]MCM0597022.1 flagellar biosynthesis protein FliQ [Periweissella fabaria]MCM0601025.1 flagellar biosynthesis protein FliQ [Periweissella ghanensis]CAH0416977.1 hypothetical protein WFA24289_01294 [Periweissella fabaria]CAH0417894.1 hypothetical protein WGH24286_00310 [Periweissella ghanensis]